MRESTYTTDRLLALRKLTRAASEFLRTEMKDYLGTLSPLLRPNTVLGGYIQGTAKDPARGAEQAFNELAALYDKVATQKPFELNRELKAPFEVISAALDINLMEYTYTAKNATQSKSVTVACPLKFTLTYTGFSPAKLTELLAARERDAAQIQSFIIHYLVMHVVTEKQTGVRKILESLHFPVTTGYSQEFGQLPLTYISSSVSTFRPPDEVLIESTEVSGMDAFEEIVNLEDIASLRDPLKERLLKLIKEDEALKASPA